MSLRRPKSLLAAALIAAASLACRAASFAPDPTGLWYNPAESGWGLSVAKQGNVAFAVLFVYDQASQPTWYVASDLQAFVNFGPDPNLAITNYAGVLYRASGPWFGGPFDPHAVSLSEAGPVELHPHTDGSMTIVYGIGGTTYEKTVQRTTWESNIALLTGGMPVGQPFVYAGRAVINSVSPNTCPAVNLGGPANQLPAQFGVSAGATPGHVSVAWGTGTDTACLIEGAYTQMGQLGSISGHMLCGPIGITPSDADPKVDITEIAANAHGFAGALTYQSNGCTYTGHIGGVRLSD